MTLIDDLEYLSKEAFEFSLQINPHAGGHETVEDWLAHFGDDSEDWISLAQRTEAVSTGKFIVGQVYPNGSVSYFSAYGTNVEDVVRKCADLCKKDRDRYQHAMKK